jgi:hypothetical protein
MQKLAIENFIATQLKPESFIPKNHDYKTEAVIQEQDFLSGITLSTVIVNYISIKSRGLKKRKYKILIGHKYCPFCSKEYKK